MIYNVAIPISVYIMGMNILSKRPTGYGETSISSHHPELNEKQRFLRFGKKSVLITPKINCFCLIERQSFCYV